MGEPKSTYENGNGLLLEWADAGVRIEAALERKNKRGQYHVTVRFKEKVLTSGFSDLLSLRDRADLRTHCGTADDSIDVLPYLTQAADILPQYLDQEESWELDYTTLADVRPERKEYLWYPMIPKAEPTSIDADPGAGKSATVVKIICHMTTGKAFPSLFDDRLEHDFTPRHVVMMTNEDDPSSTILPRISINGGNPHLVHILHGKRNAKGEVLPITMQDISMIRDALKRWNPALFVFDPIQSFFGTGVDMNQASDTRPVLDAVRNACKDYGCTPFYVRHNGKAQHAKAMHAGLGSIDIPANMRSVFGLFEDPEHPQRRILAQTKTNGRKAPSIQLELSSATYDYDLEDGEVITVEDVRVDWGSLSTLTATDLNARQWAQERHDEEEKSAIDQAREFLREVLAGGIEVTYPEVMSAAKEAGVATATLRRAKALEKVVVHKQGGPGTPWVWSLPWADTIAEMSEDGISYDE